MIICRSPLRLSIVGGGCDLKSYYSKYGCLFVSAAINQYVYVCLTETNNNEMLIRYSKIEKVKDIEDIQHPIIREALKLTSSKDINIEITSMADQSAGTGLGSSSSFTTALLKVLYKNKQRFIHAKELAELACHIEIDLVKSPIGIQDQYISAYGGITTFKVSTGGVVDVYPLNITKSNITDLQNNLIMVHVGESRSASIILQEQDNKSKSNDTDMINNLHKVQELAYRGIESLESGNLTDFGLLMKEHWENKKKRSNIMSNSYIDQIYDLALNNGAIGGKLIGAGYSGFLLLYTEERNKLLKILHNNHLKDVPISFDYEGTKIIGA